MGIEKYVLTGPMRSGKSSLILSISSKIQIYAMNEVAQYLIDLEKGKPEDEQIVPWNKFMEFQKNVFDMQLKWENEIDERSGYSKAILDRSLIDGLAYLRLNKQEKSELFKRVYIKASAKEYSQVFMCESIGDEISDAQRKDAEDRKKIEDLLLDTYGILGYSPILIPKCYNSNEIIGLSEDEKKIVKDRAIEKRADLILSYIK